MKKEIKIGILALTTLVASFFVINFLRGRDIFNREMELVGYFDDVDGLVASAPAYFKGFAAGHVSEVSYRRETDDFMVVCSVKKDFIVPQDSRMEIYSTSIMGTKGVRIVPGHSDLLCKSGSVLDTSKEADLVSSLTAMVTPLISRLDNTLDSLNTVFANVNLVLGEKNRSSIQSSLQHLNSTLAAASKVAGSIESDKINEIVSNLENLSSKLTPFVESLQGTVDNVQSMTGQLNQSDIKSAVDNIGAAASTLDQTVQGLEEPLNNVLNNVDQLVKSIQENPKKYIKITVF